MGDRCGRGSREHGWYDSKSQAVERERGGVRTRLKGSNKVRELVQQHRFSEIQIRSVSSSPETAQPATPASKGKSSNTANTSSCCHLALPSVVHSPYLFNCPPTGTPATSNHKPRLALRVPSRPPRTNNPRVGCPTVCCREFDQGASKYEKILTGDKEPDDVIVEDRN